jgi:hypothetical protein
LDEWEQKELERQHNEDYRVQRWDDWESDFFELKQEAQQAKAMFNYVLQAIQDAGVTLPIPVDTSDLVLQDDLDDYATMTYVDNSIQDLDLPQVVIQTTAPLNIDKIWIDVSGVSPVIKFYRNNAWQTANVAVFA